MKPIASLPPPTIISPAIIKTKNTIPPQHKKWVPIHQMPQNAMILTPTKLTTGQDRCIIQPAVLSSHQNSILIANISDEVLTLPKGLIIGDLETFDDIVPTHVKPNSPLVLPTIPDTLTAMQAHQMQQLLHEFSDVFAQSPTEIFSFRKIV